MKPTIALVLALAAVGCSSASSNSLSDSLDAPTLDRSSLAWTEPGATPDPDREPAPAADERDAGSAPDAGGDAGRDAGLGARDAASDAQTDAAPGADGAIDVDGGLIDTDAELPAV